MNFAHFPPTSPVWLASHETQTLLSQLFLCSYIVCIYSICYNVGGNLVFQFRGPSPRQIQSAPHKYTEVTHYSGRKAPSHADVFFCRRRRTFKIAQYDVNADWLAPLMITLFARADHVRARVGERRKMYAEMGWLEWISANILKTARVGWRAPVLLKNESSSKSTLGVSRVTK